MIAAVWLREINLSSFQRLGPFHLSPLPGVCLWTVQHALEGYSTQKKKALTEQLDGLKLPRILQMRHRETGTSEF